MDSNDLNPEIIEKPKENIEIPDGQDFQESFSEGYPQFSGEWSYGPSTETRSNVDGAPLNGENKDSNYDKDITDAAAIIGYGLDAVSRRIGVEQTVQLIKNFDATGSEDPIKDLYEYMGIDTNEEYKEVSLEAKQAKPIESEFRKESGMPATTRCSKEGAFKAIADMKELVLEVETSPKYNKLRASAKSAGKGYFEYAVSNYGKRGLTELFTVLAEQKEETPNEELTKTESSSENDDELFSGESIDTGSSSEGSGKITPEAIDKTESSLETGEKLPQEKLTETKLPPLETDDEPPLEEIIEAKPSFSETDGEALLKKLRNEAVSNNNDEENKEKLVL